MVPPQKWKRRYWLDLNGKPQIIEKAVNPLEKWIYCFFILEIKIIWIWTRALILI